MSTSEPNHVHVTIPGGEGSGIFICAENILEKILEKCYLQLEADKGVWDTHLLKMCMCTYRGGGRGSNFTNVPNSVDVHIEGMG